MWKAVLPVLLSIALFYFYSQRQNITKTKEPKDLSPSYDYVIVGGGTAGCVVAARLTENPDVTVLVLEAGQEDTKFKHTQWAPTESQLQLGDFDWQYLSEPQEKCCDALVNKQIRLPRVKGLGGCSAHFGGAHVRGAKEDYDHWRDLGNEGWAFQDVLPYFKKLENVQIDGLRDKPHLGKGGPIGILQQEPTPLTLAWMETLKKRGYRWRDDINGLDSLEGFAMGQVAIGDGIRQSTAAKYLRPVMSRTNLHVVVSAHVTKILFQTVSGKQPRAVGVEYIRNGIKFKVQANGEVIVSGGSYNTPHILMLSGIGPGSHLTQHGIPVVLDNPAVGQNMHDHPFIHVLGSINDTVGYNGVGADDKIKFALAELQFHLFGTGPLTKVGIETIGFFRSGLTNETRPDLQLYLLTSEPFKPYETINLNKEAIDAIDPGSKRATAYFAVYSILLHPHNTGRVLLASADPFDKPIIDPKVFHNDIDSAILAKGLKTVMEIANSDEVKKYDLKWHENHVPSCGQYELWSDEYLSCHAKSRTLLLYHPVGTCRMGKQNENSVVDHRLRVHGVTGLRIIDGSIFPDQVTANTFAPIVMVAEKGADMVKQDAIVK